MQYKEATLFYSEVVNYNGLIYKTRVLKASKENYRIVLTMEKSYERE